MNSKQRRFHTFSARSFARVAAPFAILVAMVAVASAQPATLGGGSSRVLFDPSYTPPATGSNLEPAPHPPLNVVSPLNFNFTPVGNLLAMQSGTPAQQALAAQVIAGFVEAGDRWRARFVDPITVNLEIDYDAIGNNVLGGASSDYSIPSYTTTRTAMAIDASSVDDASAVASLQPGGSMDFITNDTASNVAPATSPRIRDNNTSGTAASNNNFVAMSRANAKALGIIAASPARDANITFTDFTDYTSPGISWDFNPNNGIGASQIDFVGVATHEIGHTMGFFSGVDDVDYVGSPSGPGRLGANGGPYDLDQFAVYNTLDLFRFSADSLSQAGQPVGGLRDGAFGQTPTGAANNPYFSINSGATNLARFSTGDFNGDGNQASHWKDNLGIGVMDPTFGLGELGVITTLDNRAFDVIGWNPVPEPCSVALVFVAAILGLCADKRQR